MTTLIVRSSKDFENNLFGKSFAILPISELDTDIFNFGKILTTLDQDLDSLFLLGHIYKSDCHTPRINDKNALKKLLNQEHLGAQECPDRIESNSSAFIILDVFLDRTEFSSILSGHSCAPKCS